ncbi:hypothetical protein DMI69_15950 [Escherichia coli]|nr:hypothetical protein [Escherichia coli]
MAKSALFTVRNNESRPKCGAELVIRSGKHGPFLGCSQYPACDYVRPLKSSADGHIVKVLRGRFALHVAQIWYYAVDALVCLLVAVTTLNANIPNLSINRTKQQLHAPNAGRAIWSSAAPVMAKRFTPVIATGVNLPLTSNP